jgi:colanic acid biosynthesis glycosyl transferase WcaI
VTMAADLGRGVVFVNRFYLPDLSATSQMLGGIASALASDGRPVTVVTSRLRYDRGGASLPAAERLDGVEVRRVWSTRFGRDHLAGRAVDYLSFYLSAAITLLFTLRRGQVLVAKTDPPLVAIACAPAAWLRRARRVNWLQDVFPEIAVALDVPVMPGFAIRALRGLRDRACRTAAMNVVLGERMRAHFIGRGVDPARITVIPNWADGRTIRPLPAGASALRAELGLGDRFVVAYSGNLGRAHDVDTLLGAAAALHDDASVAFLMIGAGAGMAALASAAERRGLHNLLFRPYQPAERLADALAAGDVHLVSLRPELEGLIVPSKLYGIYAAGRPVLFVGDPEGEVALELARAGSGLSVACGDAAGLVAAICRLRDDPIDRARRGMAARDAFLERYTREHAADRWRAVLASL